MSLVRDTIANFIGGVSQQPDKLMFPNQSKTLVNYLPSPSVGLMDRPPTEHVARLMDVVELHPFEHTIIKEDEAYKVILTGNDIRVFTLEGEEKPVYYGDIYEVTDGTTVAYTNIKENKDTQCKEDMVLYSDVTLETKLEKYTATDFIYTGNQVEETKNKLLNYITTNQPLENLYATTIADYTFILNKTIITEMEDKFFENPFASSALIFVRQGDYATDYKIKINDKQVASYTASATDIETTKTNVIANSLKSNLVTNLGEKDWIINIQGSVILLQKKDGQPFTIQTEDSNSDRNLYAFYKDTDALSSLPLVAPNRYIMKIIGEDINIADDYYVQFKTADGSDFGTGSWQECCSPEMKYKINSSSMPHALIRESDGNFKFKEIDWADRHAGDEESAPTPSFIGNTIQDVFTHKGRLAFLAVDKSVYSDTQDIFSFFKKTTLTELDTDPIDVGSNSKMVLLKHNLPFNEELLLFSETSEFSIKGGDVFSNKSVTCDLTMEYPCSRYCKPVNSGGNGFFLFENGNHSRVMETYITSTYSINARDITEQVPSLLPKDMYKIAASTANNIACFLSTQETDSLYIYNYYYSSEQKAQSAWSKWTFKNTKILNVDFKENWLYLTMQYSDGIYLEKMNFSAKNKEATVDYLFYLDRKVYLSSSDLIIDTEDNITTFTLPYTRVNDMVVLDSRGFPLDYTILGTTVTVTGIYSALIVGNTFESIWELPTIYLRQQASNGTVKVKEGLLMLRDINLCYSNTGHFKIRVTPKFSTNITSEFEFTGKICGMKSSKLEQIPVSDGTFLLPVISRNEEVTIEVKNDSYLPSCFLSLEWLGDFIIRGQ